MESGGQQIDSGPFFSDSSYKNRVPGKFSAQTDLSGPKNIDLFRHKTLCFKTSFKNMYFDSVFRLSGPENTIFSITTYFRSTWLGLSIGVWIVTSGWEKFSANFEHKPYILDPYQKNQKIFLIQMWQFIHQSNALVELIRNKLLLKIFIVFSGPKKPKNSDFLRKFWKIN